MNIFEAIGIGWVILSTVICSAEVLVSAFYGVKKIAAWIELGRMTERDAR